MRHITKNLVALAALATLAVGMSACDTNTTDGTTHAEDVVNAQTKDGNVKPAKKAAPKKEAPKYTKGQEQAIGSALDYLEYGAFSQKGLLDQLVYEKFSKADATFAVNHIKVDWNKQAAAAAVEYLDSGSFSKAGLVDQLKYEGYTAKQAAYGVSKTGL
jgi:hypothetical protein